MVRAKDLTPEEAKQYLIEQQRQTRERQREFAQRRKEEGYKRINAFITPEAFKIIDSERKATGKNTGDVISDILETYASLIKPKSKPVKQVSKSVTTNKNKSNYDAVKFAKEIKALRDDELSFTAIAKHFVNAGYMNAKGNVSWHRSTIRRLLEKQAG